jgi:nucleotide-binding universal stress UspA family protein
MSCRVLVALDGSVASEAALGEVERIAVGGAGVHFLHVVPMLPSIVDATSAGVMAGHDRALAYLGELRERLPDLRGLDLIRAGDPAGAILQVALEFNIDLIAMGTHVRTSLATWFLGSVAETVVRRSQLPVLLRRPDLPAANKTLRRILVPLDGSGDSLAILPTVKSLALRTGAEVVFLHLSEGALAPLAPSGAPDLSGGSEDPKEKLLSLARRLEKSDMVFWQTVAEGDAVEEILDHAKTLDADLIAMSTQAGGDPERTVVGGAAIAVVGRTERAVLLQRPVVHSPAHNAWRYQ